MSTTHTPHNFSFDESMFADILEKFGGLNLFSAEEIMRRFKRSGFRYDHRRKYYLVLDCETATLACAMKYSEEERGNIALNMPLIYDIGWQIIDCYGRVYVRKSYIVNEIFNNLDIFMTAYYASKRPIYLEKIRRGEAVVANWEDIAVDLMADMAEVEAVGAYNANFDFCKAIPFTEDYFAQTKLPTAQEWMRRKMWYAEKLAHPNKEEKKAYQNKKRAEEASLSPAEKAMRNQAKENKKRFFTMRGMDFPMFDLWGMTVNHLLNCDEYKQMCLENEWSTTSGRYFPTSAETAFRFVTGCVEFEEAHTAIEDSIIESVLFAKIYQIDKTAWTVGIVANPYQKLGTVKKFVEEHF